MKKRTSSPIKLLAGKQFHSQLSLFVVGRRWFTQFGTAIADRDHHVSISIDSVIARTPAGFAGFGVSRARGSLFIYVGLIP